MLRSTALALLFGASLWALGALTWAPVDRTLYAAAVVGLGCATAVLAYGQASFLPVTAGALSPLLFTLLQDHSLGFATSVMCFAWIAPRLVLAETRVHRLVLVLLSVATAAIAGFMFSFYVEAPGSARVAACIFSGSCLSLTSLVGVRTSVAWALQSAAAVTGPPTRETLERAARAHRPSIGTSSRKLWRALVCLADQRAALSRAKNVSDADRKDLDDQIETLAEKLVPLPVLPESLAVAPPPPVSKATPDATS